MKKEYTVENIKSLGQPDQNGNSAFNVKFFEEQEAVFMLAKKAPVIGEKEFGSIFDATGKSGKSYKRFKREQREEFTPTKKPKTTDSIAMYRCNAMNNVTELLKHGIIDVNDMEDISDRIFEWLNKEVKTTPKLTPIVKDEPKEEIPLPEPQGDDVTFEEAEINLDDIPF